MDVLVDINYLQVVYSESNTPGYDPGELRWGLFEPVEVAGQPAVLLGFSSDRFNCNIVVGTGPRDSFMVTVIAEGRDADSCPRAVAIAERVVGNLAG